ncbi:hypothetical protein JXB01_01005 [Candidatus Micrarchaeota archaeon]|nr:hypothetical protein [Candidatus Micrarchaeota archaeon]
MKKLILILMLIPLCFAGWQATSGIAILASFMVLLLVYMIAFGFNLDQLKVFTQDEFYQLIVTAVILASLVGIESTFVTISTSLGDGKTIQERAIDDVGELQKNIEEAYENVLAVTKKASIQSAKSSYCNFLSTGIFISPCSAYSQLLPPVSMAAQLLSVSIAESASLQILLEIGNRFGFNILLPVGLFMRAFRFSRGGGGFLMALGIVLYFVLPLSTVFTYDLITEYKNDEGIDFTIETSELGECEEGKVIDENYKEPQDFAGYFFEEKLEEYVFFFLIECTLFVVIVLLISITALRWITSAGGAEVDVSALAKIA